MQISVKGGGHSYAANSVADGGLLIDLSPMKGVTVDATARTVTVEAGVTCAEMDAATQAHGLATPHANRIVPSESLARHLAAVPATSREPSG